VPRAELQYLPLLVINDAMNICGMGFDLILLCLLLQDRSRVEQRALADQILILNKNKTQKPPK